MLKLTFKDSVTSQQRAWWNEALSHMTWPYDAATVEFEATVETVDEPPCEGHAEYMCTFVWTYSDGRRPTVEFFMRTGADDPTQSFNAGVADDVKSFFMESVVHEYGHAITYVFMTHDDVSKAKIAAWFQQKKTGKSGALADWDAEDAAWEDKIAEGLAETFKDVWMPAANRYFNNRTNWWITQRSYAEFIDYLYDFLCPSPITDT
jgi:hypothetical protein